MSDMNKQASEIPDTYSDYENAVTRDRNWNVSELAKVALIGVGIGVSWELATLTGIVKEIGAVATGVVACLGSFVHSRRSKSN